jgi:hypothetical protein
VSSTRDLLRIRGGAVTRGGNVQSSDWEITVLVLSLRIVLAILEIVKARRGNGEPTQRPD